MILRTAARAMLASIFIYGGIDQLKDPKGKVDVAEDVTGEVADRVEQLPDDTETLIRMNGAVQLGAGLLLATNTFARPASLALAGTLLPTTAAAHRFWEADAGATRQQQLVQFLKNLGLLGGLLITAMDTEGEPGMAWKAAHAVDHAQLLADHKKEVAGLQADLARERARAGSAETRAKISATTKAAKRDAKLLAKAGRGSAKALRGTGRSVKKAVKAATPL